MSTAKLHVIGPAHQARYSELFDQELANAISSTLLPARAEAELDHTALLVVLSHFAGPGRYDPAEPPASDPTNLSLLVVDPDTPPLRSFAWAWWTNGRAQGRFIFTGTTLSPDQTVVANIWFEPA